MNTVRVGDSLIDASQLAYGCWRIADPGVDGRAALVAACDAGYTLFDVADVYGGGKAEETIGRALRDVSGMRDRIRLVTKCGVRPGRYDFSFDHIVASCDASLARLGVEAIDLYLLHRPDFLADPDEIARAFTTLHTAGKVRWFGVSNFRPSLLAAVRAASPLPLVAHQVEISLTRLDAFTDGVLDQCLDHQMTPMAWSPLGAGLLADGARRMLPAQRSYRPEAVVTALDDLSRDRGESRAVLALAWLLKHPSRIMPIVGSTDPHRIRDAVRATAIELTREEWYALFVAARGEPLP